MRAGVIRANAKEEALARKFPCLPPKLQASIGKSGDPRLIVRKTAAPGLTLQEILF